MTPTICTNCSHHVDYFDICQASCFTCEQTIKDHKCPKERDNNGKEREVGYQSGNR